MTNDTQNFVTIDDVEYEFASLSENQKLLVQHVADLDRKLATAKFTLVQLQVGREAFYKMLKDELAGNK